MGVRHLQLNTVEFEPPTLEHIQKGLDFIEEVAQVDDGVTYIHCKAGRIRSATIAACYLIKVFNRARIEKD